MVNGMTYHVIHATLANGQSIRASGYSLEKALERLNALNPKNLMIYNTEHMIAL